jgi:hypothetical protein
MEMEGTAVLKNVVGDMDSFPARIIRLPQGEYYTAKDGESTWSWPGAIPDRFGIKAVEGKRTVLIVTGWDGVGFPYLHGFTEDNADDWSDDDWDEMLMAMLCEAADD